MNAWETKRRTDDATIYLFSKCESLIEIYAKSAGLSARELTHRVAALLLAPEGGEVLGTQNSLSALRRNGTPGNQPVEQVEVARGTHRRAQVTRTHNVSSQGRATMRRNAARARAARWPKKADAPFKKGFSYEGKHWTQQPENKARLRAQMKRTFAAVAAKKGKP